MIDPTVALVAAGGVTAGAVGRAAWVRSPARARFVKWRMARKLDDAAGLAEQAPLLVATTDFAFGPGEDDIVRRGTVVTPDHPAVRLHPNRFTTKG